jgi:hypothetical protein
MKLLSLNSYNYRRGGSDVVFLEHDAMFRAHGWDTAVMTMHHPKNEASSWSRFFAGEIEFNCEHEIVDKLTMKNKAMALSLFIDFRLSFQQLLAQLQYGHSKF